MSFGYDAVTIYQRMSFYSMYWMYVCYWSVFFPQAGEYIDTKIGVNWNEKLLEQVYIWSDKIHETGDKIENKLDNPAPNTTRNIEGRTGQ